MFLKAIFDMDQQNMYNQISEQNGARDPETDVVMGIALMKESNFVENRLSQTLTKARKVSILFPLQPKS